MGVFAKISKKHLDGSILDVLAEHCRGISSFCRGKEVESWSVAEDAEADNATDFLSMGFSIIYTDKRAQHTYIGLIFYKTRHFLYLRKGINVYLYPWTKQIWQLLFYFSSRPPTLPPLNLFPSHSPFPSPFPLPLRYYEVVFNVTLRENIKNVRGL